MTRILWLGMKLLGCFFGFSIIGILFRLVADQFYMRVTWPYVHFAFEDPNPPATATDLLHANVSMNSLPFGLSFNGMRLATILVALPIALGLAYVANKVFKPKSFIFVPVALAGFFIFFYQSNAGVLDPSLVNSAVFMAVFSVAFLLLFRRQAASNHGADYPKFFVMDPPGTKHAPKILAVVALVLVALSLLFFRHPKPMMQSEIVDVANQFFDAVGKNDQATINRLVLSSDEWEQLNGGGAFEFSKHAKIDPSHISAMSESTDDSGTYCKLESFRDLANLRKCYLGLPYPVSYSTELDDQYGKTLILNFDCPHAPPNACVTHLRLTFTVERPVRIESIQDARNTAEWEKVWPMVSGKLVAKPVPARVFRLPIVNADKPH